MNEQSQNAKQDPSSKLILIVDDDENIIEYLITLLHKEGFRTKSAMDGKIALKRVLEEKTDLILLDMMMPNAGGYEVLKPLQAKEETRDIPVFVVSAKVSDRSTWDMIKQEPNVKEVIPKPIRPFQFVQKVHEVLHTLSPDERRRLEREKGRENTQKSSSADTWEMPPGFRKKGDQ
ncbi:MAG: response regulator [bacterium]